MDAEPGPVRAGTVGLGLAALVLAGCTTPGYCTIDSVFAFSGIDHVFDLPVGPDRADLLAEGWRNASVHLRVSSPEGTQVRLPATPLVERDQDRVVLQYGLARNDTDFLIDVAYGRTYTWRLEAVARAEDPRVEDLPFFPGNRTVLEGTLRVVHRDDVPDRVDDEIGVVLDGQPLPHAPFPKLPIPSGDLFISGRGTCVN